MKPISNYLDSLFSNHGLPKSDASSVVTNILDRLVTGGYGWDKMLQYHAKVIIERILSYYIVCFLQGEEKFTKKLIPYVFMSKDDFPESISAEKVLLGIFQFIDEWKLKLFNMITSDTTREEMQVRWLFKIDQ